MPVTSLVVLRYNSYKKCTTMSESPLLSNVCMVNLKHRKMNYLTIGEE